jgi:hypothetical protein
VPVPGERLLDRMTDLEWAMVRKFNRLHDEGHQKEAYDLWVEWRWRIERRREMEVAANAC